MFLRLLARDRQIPAFLYSVTLATTGIWQSPSSEYDIVKVVGLMPYSSPVLSVVAHTNHYSIASELRFDRVWNLENRGRRLSVSK